jgi:hypothetical protein
MLLGSRRLAALLALIALVVAACGSSSPSSPGPSGGSGRPSAAASGATSPDPAASGAPSANASPAGTPPTVAAFWSAAARALSKSGRVRVVQTGGSARELRFEPNASAVAADGNLASVCLGGNSYTIQGMQSTPVPGNWSCGGTALTASFRKSGQPAYAWSTTVPTDTKIKERVAATARDRWQWTYTATSKALGGSVKTILTMDSTSGRLISGTRTDKTGTTRYTFSYTTILAPIALP